MQQPGVHQRSLGATEVLFLHESVVVCCGVVV